MKLTLRNLVRIIFLLAFLYLWYLGKAGMWGPLVLAGLVATPFLGRIYCGWVCPVSTSLDLLKPLFPKAPLANYESIMLQRKVNALVFFLLLAYLLILNIKMGFAIHLFIIMIPLGLILALLFSEKAAHRNCFIGIIYSWLGRRSIFSYLAGKGTCTACSRCISECPNKCLSLSSSAQIITDRKNCLLCGKCASVCPSRNIRYGRQLT
jgi:ferredoxin-type protein NapH